MMLSCCVFIQDLNHDPSNPKTRLYATHAAQPYHNDASDIVGECCDSPKLVGPLSLQDCLCCGIIGFGYCIVLIAKLAKLAVGALASCFTVHTRSLIFVKALPYARLRRCAAPYMSDIAFCLQHCCA